jgi:Cellulase (glycosyl hydrolase family 5)
MNDSMRRSVHGLGRSLGGCALLVSGAALAASCGSSSGTATGAGAGSTSGTTASGSAASGSGGAMGTTGGSSTTGSAAGGSPATSTGAGGGAGPSGTGGATTSSSGGGGSSPAGPPAGWLYTSGAKIYVSDGHAGGTPWMGRGVNLDDIYLCGYNYTLWMTGPDQALETIISGLISGWKPSFVRVSLSMASNPTMTSWLSDPAQYKTPMTGVIDSIGTHPGVYVLVTLRSDASMIGQDESDGDAEATGLPSDSATTPSATLYPTGTDATYVALVDSFAQASFVAFGLTNEPGGDKLTDAQISAAMSHAVGVIRAEEDHLGVPHHLVSVQGNGWTSDISFYAATPLPYDNVIYEVHGYPPATSSYTYANIPVILGEYGDLPNSLLFYADVEQKQIPNMAWDFEPYSDCAPDLLEVDHSASTLTPTAWGSSVQSYLLAHAQ